MGYRGTFVIPLRQTEIDGIAGAPVSAICVGSHLRWRGEAARIDGPAEVLVLDRPEAAEELRGRAQRSARRLLGDMAGTRGRTAPAGHGGAAPGFALTDGRATYRLIPAGEGRLLTVTGPLPPRDTDLVVIERMAEPDDPARLPGAGSGLICFAAGTLLDTPDGPRRVEAIAPGDRLATRDSGAQEVIWTGRQHLSGARLFAMPHLRPMRLRPGALAGDRPAGDLIVSPEHRLLLRGAAARDLFSEEEVLVAARDLVDGHAVRVAAGLREVTYIHLLTARHEIVRANGVECETFHPASADLTLIAPGERAALAAIAPGVDEDPFAYGGFARRSLSASEAAILRHAGADGAFGG